MTASAAAHVTLRILSQPRYLCIVRSAVETTARLYGLNEQECGRVMLAVDEALTNVIRHAYQRAAERPIDVQLAPVSQAGRDGIAIIIEDESTGVDLTKIKSRPLDEIRPGGLGVHIIHDIMDEVSYTRRPNGGVRLAMYKYAAAAPAS